MRLTLFVGEASAATDAAVATLRRLVEDQPDAFELRIIDVHRQPEAAERHRVIATPTLIRELPPPVRRIIGDLSRHERVRVALDLTADLAENLTRGTQDPSPDPDPEA
ncbi:putative circadian clock protein KaiB [Phycisphaera mikurensis NBRC 102666]|uniref:Putative circadian clock protein KaiB n=1 Tax=Phycisphaera mikurensis (strain NBRC 102666 / KCTC 22515 / FYK2301M01) TaxID=1142394 RepID=I0IAG6_PHYMF|nr:putative circadian clock protein KaiB [Phycisphaera mikurensis NBRC 102666]